jgi:hypothetical protein
MPENLIYEQQKLIIILTTFITYNNEEVTYNSISIRKRLEKVRNKWPYLNTTGAAWG